MSNEDDARTYCVLVNHEEQYSMWLAGRPVPVGWREAGMTGSKADCLAYVKDVWVDMRPLSLRQADQSVKQDKAA